MKSLFLLVVISLGATLPGCSSSTETVQPTEQPVIYGFGQDTLSPGSAVLIIGRNLEFCKVWLGDSLLPWHDTLQSNYITASIPAWANTNYIYVSNDGAYKARSPKPLVIYHPPAYIYTTMAPTSGEPGERVVIYGAHFLSQKDSLVLLYNNLLIPIDHVFDDSLVFHVPTNAVSAAVTLISGTKVLASFGFSIVRSFVWRHCRLAIVGYEFTGLHRVTGFVNHNQRIDSTWYEHRQLNWTQSFDILAHQAPFSNTVFGISQSAQLDGPLGSVSLSLSWDTSGTQVTARVTASGHTNGIMPVSFGYDTSVSFTVFLTDARLDTKASTSLIFPLSQLQNQPGISYSHSEADHLGEHSWIETTQWYPTPIYGVGRLTVDLTP